MGFGRGLSVALLLSLAAMGCGGGNSPKPSGDGGVDAGDDSATPGTDGAVKDDGAVNIPTDAGVELGTEFGEVTGATEFTQITPGTPNDGVRCDDVKYDSLGISIAGQVCRPTTGDNFPILMVNHGLGSYKQSAAAAYAKLGYAVFESAYRGESPSAGMKDYCSDEVYDVRRMLQIAKAQDYVNASRVGMVGYSHGGCITMKTLLAEHLAGTTEFEAVVDFFGPSDWSATYNLIQSDIDMLFGCSDINLLTKQWCDTLKDLRRATGGTPPQAEAAYAERSPITYASLIKQVDVPLLIMHATGDAIVPHQSNCTLAAELGGFDAWHINGGGNVTTDAPCTGALTWKSGTAPTTTYSANRTLVIYDTVFPLGHDQGLGAGTTMQSRGFAFLANKFAP